ncbi:MAG: FAD/NAD(P)-binding protein [Armatimonadetes bacterium]|nr:FAD/NAD(P)-binding protein [Armatimonadota bacterium]
MAPRATVDIRHVEPDHDLYVPQPARIKRIEQLTETEKFFEVELESGEPLGHHPGQFVQVFAPGIDEAPISLSSAPNGRTSFDLVVRRIGNVTTAIHGLEVGEAIGIRGPLGKGFPMDELKGHDVLIVGGGIGLVPLRGVIQALLAERDAYERVIIFAGFKSPAEILFRDELAEWEQRDDVELYVTIDRPHPDWDGHVGVITTLFPEVELNPPKTKAVICGPPIMYRFVLAETRSKGIADEDTLLSLERRMRCGVGKCGHCQINNKYCCLDGPVFKYSELKFMWEAI